MPANARVGRFVSVITRATVVVLILVTGLGAYVLLVQTRPEIAQTGGLDAVRRVPAFEVDAVAVPRQWGGQGSTRAMDAVNVPARVVSTVLEVPETIRPGHRVERGELLMVLDSEDFERQRDLLTHELEGLRAELALLDSERAQLEAQMGLDEQLVEIAQSTFNDAQQLMDRQAGSRRDLDVARRNLLESQRTQVLNREMHAGLTAREQSLHARKAAQAQRLAMMQLNLERCRVTSPIDGFIQSVDVEEGEHVHDGKRLVRVVSLDRIEAVLRLPASTRSFLRQGDRVLLRHAGRSNHIWEGTLIRVAPEDDPGARTLSAYVVVNQKPLIDALTSTAVGMAADQWQEHAPILFPNSFVTATVVSATAEPRVIVPQRAIRSGRVMIIDQPHEARQHDESVTLGHVRTEELEVDFMFEMDLPATGLPDRQWVALKGGLAPGTLLVLNISTTLADGEPVVAIVAGQAQGADTLGIIRETQP